MTGPGGIGKTLQAVAAAEAGGRAGETEFMADDHMEAGVYAIGHIDRAV